MLKKTSLQKKLLQSSNISCELVRNTIHNSIGSWGMMNSPKKEPVLCVLPFDKFFFTSVFLQRKQHSETLKDFSFD